jgi:tetratricopeptide (TPR) repeat protein
VRPEAVDHVVQLQQRGPKALFVLDRLVDKQLVRRDGEHYLLPREYWRYALARVPVEPAGNQAAAEVYTQRTLALRAAEYFAGARKSPEECQRIEDLTAQLVEFDLRVRGEDWERAFEVLSSIDWRFLVPWGHARKVVELHSLLEGRLTDPAQQQASIGMIGTAYYELSKYAKAVRYYQRAIRVAQPLESQLMRKRWVTNLGSAHYQLGETRTALRQYEEALELARQAKILAEEAAPLSGLALCHADLGQFELAREYNEQALLVATATANLRLLAEQLATAGQLHGELGEPALARPRFDHALAVARGDGYRLMEGHCLVDLAEIDLDEASFMDARGLARRALRVNHHLGNPELARHGNYVVALADLCMNDVDGARVAVDVACDYGVKQWSRCPAALQGIVMLRQEDRDEAYDAFDLAIAEADALLDDASDRFAALDVMGLAWLGIAVAGKEYRLGEAAEAFVAARAVTQAPGVIARVRRLLDELAKADRDGLVAQIRPVAESTG